MMRNPRSTFLAVTFLLAVAGCDGSSSNPSSDPGDIVFGGPSAEGTVTSFSFPIRIEIDPAGYRADTLLVRLNGEPVALAGGPSVFTATIQPGSPLRDDNTLEVTIQPTSGGAPVVSSREFRYLPPKARIQKITDEDQLIAGPLATGRVGDYLLSNAKARFIVQDVAKRDLYSVGTFGGNLIDAELTDRPGTDNFLEVQPAINVETVINAQTVEVVNDGQDGTAAILRTCGPDDTIDFINPSALIEAAGLQFPDSADDQDHDVEGCTDYVLAPEKTFVELTTTIFNNEAEDLGLYAGDYINGSGELDQFTTLGAGIGEALTNRLNAMSYIGIGEAEGVDYAFVLLPEGPSDRSSFFTTSGVSYIVHNQGVVNIVLSGEAPRFTVTAGGSRSFTRYFGVGHGSVASAIDIQNEVLDNETGTLRSCVTSGGKPLSGARVSVGRNVNGEIRQIATQFVTGSDGCYAGTLEPGSYLLAAAKRGYLYEGGGTSPVYHPITITAGAETREDVVLPPTARLRVTVRDHENKAVPGRVSVVGPDPSPETLLSLSTPIGTSNTGLFNDITKDSTPFGIAWLEYVNADGLAEFDMEPGDYTVFVSRGTEYSLHQVAVTLRANETTPVEARIAPVVDTEGFISSDFHVHGIRSADSRVSDRNRVFQFAGEGVDNIIMTDHEANTDLNPPIRAHGFERFVHATIGEEITTSDYGHFNSYPMRIVPELPSRGSVDWAVGAEPGRDFPSYGSYSLTPAAIAALAKSGPSSTAATTIQINHIDSHFGPLKIDTSAVPPRSFLTDEEKLRFRLDPRTANLFHHFPALELWNGSSRGKQSEFVDKRLGVWFNHLNQGLHTTGIGDTDTHEFMALGVAGARTWTASSTDNPQRIDPTEVADAVDTGRAIFGQGPFVEARLIAADGSNRFADLRRDGQTLVRTANRGVDLEIRVQSPAWAEFDTIDIYANAPTTVTDRSGEVPVEFTSAPTRTLRLGEDFQIERVAPFASLPSAERLETVVTVSFRDLPEDTWFVVAARGTNGRSRPMFPVMPSDLRTQNNTTAAELSDGNLGEGGVLALGMTNPLYADVDGVDGFQPPIQP